MVLVVTPSWDDVTGTIQTFERENRTSEWHPVYGPSEISLGSKGLAWGTGIHGGALTPGPVKREGDLKSPAGAFRLASLYGYAPEAMAQRFSMPYLSLDSTHECIDDPSSMYYNMIVDRANVRNVDWKSSEWMRFQGRYYEWGVVVEQNTDPRVAGGGSCIFLHVWGGSASSTSGCTSLDRDGLLRIMDWLSPAGRPVLVQLPLVEYERLKEEWHLP